MFSPADRIGIGKRPMARRRYQQHHWMRNELELMFASQRGNPLSMDNFRNRSGPPQTARTCPFLLGAGSSFGVAHLLGASRLIRYPVRRRSDRQIQFQFDSALIALTSPRTLPGTSRAPARESLYSIMVDGISNRCGTLTHCSRLKLAPSQANINPPTFRACCRRSKVSRPYTPVVREIVESPLPGRLRVRESEECQQPGPET